MSDAAERAFLQRAIALAADCLTKPTDGPFGAVVVRDGRIVAEGQNRVTQDNDPTAHAEVVAIRNACATEGTFHLAPGAVLYTSCEPCPMCLAAAYWARLDRIVYGCTRDDAAAIGFDDEVIYRELALPIAEKDTKSYSGEIRDCEVTYYAQPRNSEAVSQEVMLQAGAGTVDSRKKTFGLRDNVVVRMNEAAPDGSPLETRIETPALFVDWPLRQLTSSEFVSLKRQNASVQGHGLEADDARRQLEFVFLETIDDAVKAALEPAPAGIASAAA